MFVALIVFALLQMVAGFMIGKLVTAQQTKRSRAESAAGVRCFSRRAGETIRGVRADIGHHREELGRVEEELTCDAKERRNAGETLGETESGLNEPLNDLVLHAINQIVGLNKQLEQRLNQAEDQIRSQAEQLEAQLSEALTDPLTELANRRSFDRELDRLLALWHRKQALFSLILVDIDHFKRLNDKHGHPAGDAVLKETAGRLLRVMRQMDLVARIGGEEFAVLLPQTDLASAAVAVERLRACMADAPFYSESGDLSVTASFGLTCAAPQDTPQVIVKRADQALYDAKHDGRNCGFQRCDGKSKRISPPDSSSRANTLPQRKTDNANVDPRPVLEDQSKSPSETSSDLANTTASSTNECPEKAVPPTRQQRPDDDPLGELLRKQCGIEHPQDTTKPPSDIESTVIMVSDISKELQDNLRQRMAEVVDENTRR